MSVATIRYEDFLHRFPHAEDKGKYILAPCPFHSDNAPSLLIFKDGWFRCLGASCNRVGSWNMLWNRLQGRQMFIYPERRTLKKTPDAIKDFDTREELAYAAHNHLIKFNRGWYIEERGLADAIELHEIGYWRGWYTFPVVDREYKFVNVIFRTSPHVQQVLDIRYWADFKPTMYVPDWHLLNKGDYLVIVFGILDALTLNKFRYPVVTPTHGHIFDPDWLAGYRKPIFIVPDRGEEKAGLKLIGSLGWRGKMIRLDYPEGMKDANDFLKAGRQDELLAQLERKLR